MKNPIYLLVGVPGTGKTWVTDRIGHEFEFVSHDKCLKDGEPYVPAILSKWKDADKPLLIEAPFSVSAIKKPLEDAGAKVHVAMVIEDEGVLADRYQKDPLRDGKPLPKGHLTRQKTYLSRVGNSSEVLEKLKADATKWRVEKHLS